MDLRSLGKADTLDIITSLTSITGDASRAFGLAWPVNYVVAIVHPASD